MRIFRAALVVLLALTMGSWWASAAFAGTVDLQPDAVTTTTGTPVTVDELNNDTLDTPPYTVTVDTPSNGTASVLGDNRISYTPDSGFVGDDVFSYYVTDGDGASSSATVTVTVTDPNSITTPGPLTLVRTTPDLNCDYKHSGDSTGAFYGDTACGTFLVVDGQLFGPASVPAGIGGSPAWTPVSQGRTGAGTDANPYVITTVVDAGTTGVRLTQRDTYVVGQESVRTDVQLDNSGGARDVRLYRAADCYLADSDSGLGSTTPQTGAVACTSATPGSNRVIQWQPLSSGSHFMEAGYSDVWNKISSQAPFPDTCLCTTDLDNGAGLSWDVSLPASGQQTRSSLITFSPSGALPMSTAVAANPSSVSPAGTVTYDVTVSNPGATASRLSSVTDTLPAGFSYIAGSSSGVTTSDPTTGSGVLTWSLTGVTVPPGGSVTQTFQATATSTPGTYSDNAGGASPDVYVTGSGDAAPVTVTGGPTDTTPPGPVTDLTATPGDGTVDLGWNNPTDADLASIRVFYAEGTTAPSFGSGTEVTLAGPTATSASVSGLTNDTTYSFSVFAVDSSDNHSSPMSISAMPTAPAAGIDPVTDLQAAGAGSGAVRLTWTNPATLDGIVVRYSTVDYPAGPADGTGVPLSGTPTGVTVSGLTDGTPYFFSVFATQGAQTSDPATVSQTPFACPDMRSALSAPAGLITDASWVACSAPDANDGANTLNTVLPRVGATQALMTTGDRSVANPPDTSGSSGRDNQSGQRGAYDVSIYKLDLNVPAGAKCLSFDYVFASEEYPEYVGTTYNDGFLAQLDTNAWSVDQQTITATDNFAKTSDGSYVSVNSPVFATPADVVTPPANGTGYDGMSQALRANTAVTPGSHSLYLSIFDAGDGVLDSAAFIDNLHTTTTDCSSGTVVNHPPVANTDTASAVAGTAKTIDVLGNDTDADGDALTITGTSSPSHGTVTCSTTCSYTGTAGYSGPDSFTYTISDGHGGQATGTVNLTVTAPPPTPVSTLTIGSAATALTWPQGVTITGVAKSSAGSGLVGRTIELWAKPAGGSYAQVDSVTSGTGGSLTSTQHPTTGTTYQWRVPGSTVHSTERAVTLKPQVTIASNVHRLPYGKRVTISGTSAPQRSGSPVRLQKLVNGAWTTLSSSTFVAGPSSTDPATYSFSPLMRTNGVTRFRVLVPADSGRLAATTGQIAVTVYRASLVAFHATSPESLTLKNIGTVPLDTTGWTLTNSTGTVVPLPARTVARGATLKIVTGAGRSTTSTVFLGVPPMFGDTHDDIQVLDGTYLVVRKTY